MDTKTTEKTNLEMLLFKYNISNDRLAKVINAKSTKTVYNKVHRIYDFSLPEAVAIKVNLFPDYALDYIFEGYNELKPTT